MYGTRLSSGGVMVALMSLVLASGCGSTDGDDEEHLGEPQQAALIASSPQGVATGRGHSLALLPDGTVRAWGIGWGGVLGVGTADDHFTPVPVKDLFSVVAVAANNSHSLALRSDGTVWAWGNNLLVGTGTGFNTSVPIQVPLPGIPGAVAIAAGLNHSLALLSDGTVWAWGFNDKGQLGDGTTTNHLTPVKVGTLSGVVAIAVGGDHNLAVLDDGSVLAWGANSKGQLGDGSTVDRSTPVLVSGLPPSPITAVDVGAGEDYSLAVLSDGTVRAWGSNDRGQLGDGTKLNSLTPVQVKDLTDIVRVDGGSMMNHTIAVTSYGTVWSWGNNVFGQLASGTSACFAFPYDLTEPVASVGLSDVVSVSAVQHGSVIQKSDGSVWVWGDNNLGRWASGATGGCTPTPRQVAFP